MSVHYLFRGFAYILNVYVAACIFFFEQHERPIATVFSSKDPHFPPGSPASTLLPIEDVLIASPLTALYGGLSTVQVVPSGTRTGVGRSLKPVLPVGPELPKGVRFIPKDCQRRVAFPCHPQFAVARKYGALGYAANFVTFPEGFDVGRRVAVQCFSNLVLFYSEENILAFLEHWKDTFLPFPMLAIAPSKLTLPDGTITRGYFYVQTCGARGYRPIPRRVHFPSVPAEIMMACADPSVKDASCEKFHTNNPALIRALKQRALEEENGDKERPSKKPRP